MLDTSSSLESPDSPAAFTPAAVKPRADGWTPQKQRGFIEALAEGGSVEHAARSVGMNRASAYRLRHRPGGADFAAAWDGAMAHIVEKLEHATFERALNGTVKPVFHKGEQVGEVRLWSERLAMFLLRGHNSKRYGVQSHPAYAKLPDDNAIAKSALARWLAKITTR
jgi:hypothetical protein